MFFPDFPRKCRAFLFSSIGVFLVAAICYAQSVKQVPHRPPDHPAEFIITTERDFRFGNYGLLMACPAHEHGTPEEAMAELLALLKKPRNQPATIYVCRESQKQTLVQFGQMVDRIVTNPFVSFEDATSHQSSPWATSSNQLLKNIAAIRETCRQRQLIACFSLGLDPKSVFGEKRAPSFEEIQWMLLAICGGGYQGVAFRGEVSDIRLADRVSSFCNEIHTAAPNLAQASQVNWVIAKGELHVSALRSSNKLFVIILRPEYMNVGKSFDSGYFIEFPPTISNRFHVDLTFDLPTGLVVAGGKASNGQNLSVLTSNQRQNVQYNGTGGGTFLVFDLAGPALADIPELGASTEMKKSAASEGAKHQDQAPNLLQKLLHSDAKGFSD